MKGTDGKFYSKNLINNCVIRFSGGFNGCLDCGSESHLVRIYHDRASKEIKLDFQSLYAHVPPTRKTGVYPVAQYNSLSIYSRTLLTHPQTLSTNSHSNTLSINLNTNQPPVKGRVLCYFC